MTEQQRAPYGGLPPHVAGSHTSRAAAVAVAPKAATKRERVYQAIALRGELGATAEELEFFLRLSGNTVRPRLCELEGRGRVVKTTMTRPTRSGHAATVYVAVAGRES